MDKMDKRAADRTIALMAKTTAEGLTVHRVEAVDGPVDPLLVLRDNKDLGQEVSRLTVTSPFPAEVLCTLVEERWHRAGLAAEYGGSWFVVSEELVRLELEWAVNLHMDSQQCSQVNEVLDYVGRLLKVEDLYRHCRIQRASYWVRTLGNLRSTAHPFYNLMKDFTYRRSHGGQAQWAACPYSQEQVLVALRALMAALDKTDSAWGWQADAQLAQLMEDSAIASFKMSVYLCHLEQAKHEAYWTKRHTAEGESTFLLHWLARDMFGQNKDCLELRVLTPSYRNELYALSIKNRFSGAYLKWLAKQLNISKGQQIVTKVKQLFHHTPFALRTVAPH